MAAPYAGLGDTPVNSVLGTPPKAERQVGSVEVEKHWTHPTLTLWVGYRSSVSLIAATGCSRSSGHTLDFVESKSDEMFLCGRRRHLSYTLTLGAAKG